MGVRDLFKGAHEGPGATQQLINQHSEGVLIAAAQRTPLQLFWRGIEHGALKINHIRDETIRNNGGAEIVEDNVVLLGEQHVLRLDIPMNKLVLMHIVKRVSDLP